ncbi:flagellar filament capping protein FliD [Gracilimonas mengyeensis]|uniref:Flagellar hook-associated protein 2 n=1 Tax=Gracilimonas mengyeensis TaxID=1302730 RepID=A0A521FI59_9BACT|nr:flagellar filament capping protein FliD [Gracilimonas mengyeensis]SMO95893.1 Flagellar capping protein FliD [Gracilimonas mengyeensis]
MSTIQSLFRQSNPYEQFVVQLVELESQTKYRLELQKETQSEQKKALGDVTKSISSFISKLDEFQNPANKMFQELTTSSSDEDVVRVNSASGIDRTSNFNIDVERIAKRDTQLSQVVTGANTDLAAFGNGSIDITIGGKTETITVDTQKDDGTGTMVDKTNEEIMDSFAEAFKVAFENEAQASVFSTNGTDVQLSLASFETGTANKIEISGATGVLAEISSGLTRLTPETELDARFTVDGVTFERSSNTVDDAIEGLDFTLLKGGNSNATMSVQKDLEASKGNIQEFIDTYNEMNRVIRSRTFIDGETGNKGPLQGVRSIRNLMVNMRLAGIQPDGGAAAGTIDSFSDFGITFENNGAMKIDDEDKLMEALNERPDEIAALFNSETSAVGQMKTMAESYTKSGGMLSAVENGIDQKIDRLDRRIASEERYLQDYEERQREQFNKLQQIIANGEQQFQSVMNFRMNQGY